jgi:hypothetical protein
VQYRAFLPRVFEARCARLWWRRFEVFRDCVPHCVPRPNRSTAMPLTLRPTKTTLYSSCCSVAPFACQKIPAPNGSTRSLGGWGESSSPTVRPSCLDFAETRLRDLENSTAQVVGDCRTKPWTTSSCRNGCSREEQPVNRVAFALQKGRLLLRN